MGIEDLIKCYQKKIGTYDKQQWEKNVEQRIVYGINHIQFKRATPKTDLIDLDLVRGSSFTKAKPKHGIVTVARLATLRILFLPLYSKWWVRQTSGKIFSILLVLYLLQLFNLAIYSYNTSAVMDDFLENVPSSEIIVPVLMMWVLSFIHSQIVATNPGPDNIKLQPKYKKTCRRVHRVRKSRHAVFSEDVRCCEDNTPGAARSAPRPKWKDKEVLNRSSSKTENVTFDVADTPEKVNRRTVGKVKTGVDHRTPGVRRANNGHPLEDDGFESLNGNGSSPSDNGDESGLPRKSRPKRKGPEKLDEKDGQSTSGQRCDQWVKEVQGSRKKFHLKRRQSAPDLRFSSGELDTDSDTSVDIVDRLHMPLTDRRASQIPVLLKPHDECVCDTDEEGECETMSSPETVGSGQIKAAVSATEWMGVTTNSEDCSYSSDFSEIDIQSESYDNDAPPTSILSPHCGPSDRVSCTVWEKREIKKADFSVFDISSVIIAKVDKMPENMDYFYVGMFTTTIIAILPITCRFCYSMVDWSNPDELQVNLIEILHLVLSKFSNSFAEVLVSMLGATTWQRTIMLTAAFQRWVLGFLLFFLMAVAERTFKQRFLYAKLFSHLTSSRRARKSELPHFRLNKVRNIKTWLSVRSYLRKRGPQRSVDVIVSAAFIVTLLLLSFLCMELLKESFVLNSQYNLEIIIWSVGLGIMVLRFMTLGIKINKKYRNLSVLITEQINLYLQIELKPNKKDELMVANSVLKLAADLLKELESQFKILGLSANPFLYNITKVVILSALSGVLSEILGFKLKLHKIKIK